MSHGQDVWFFDHNSSLPEEADGDNDDKEKDEADGQNEIAVFRVGVSDSDSFVSDRLVAVFALLVSRILAVDVSITNKIPVDTLLPIFGPTDKLVQTAAQFIRTVRTVRNSVTYFRRRQTMT